MLSNLHHEDIFEKNQGIEVFIGRRSPFTRSEQLAVVAGEYIVDNEKIILLAVGPKRMDYQKAAKIFQSLKNFGMPNVYDLP